MFGSIAFVVWRESVEALLVIAAAHFYLAATFAPDVSAAAIGAAKAGIGHAAVAHGVEHAGGSIHAGIAG